MVDSVRFIHARHIATMGPKGVIDDGVLAITAGKVVSVGAKRDLKPPRIDFKFDGLVTPGLVNAHTHLELSDQTAGAPPAGGFAAWLVNVLQRSSKEATELERLVTQAIGIGTKQCLDFGVTTLGDISKQCRLTRRLLRASPLRIVSFGEVQALARRRGLLDERLTTALDASDASDRLHIGITPHAPYSIEFDGYQACLAAAAARVMPLATHLAESPDEAPFLAEHSGGFRHLWEAVIGQWDERVPRFDGGPIAFAGDIGLLNYPTLLAHVNYCDDVDLERLAGGKASVVWCPRTHAYFGHPPHRWREMRAAGITVCVGTDSCASSPDLNLMDDLRLVRRQCPDESAEALWRLVTTSAAAALRWGDGLGQLVPGSFADFVCWPTSSNNPLTEVLDTPTLRPHGPVWINGEPVGH